MKWDSGIVSLTTPSLPQCQDVISKLRENNHHVVTSVVLVWKFVLVIVLVLVERQLFF